MTITQVTAKDLFRAAYENRYTWDKNFPGYSAEITYKYEDQSIKGIARINQDLKAEVLGIDDEHAQKAIHNQLWETSIHRVRRSFDDTHGANTFSYGDTDENGRVEILVGGKSAGDKYKLSNNEVCLVCRHINGVLVTINTFASYNTGEGYLSCRYDSVYHDPKTGEQRGDKSNFSDQYQKVGNYFILSHRIISTGIAGETLPQEFIFENIQLSGISV
ncbi:hypothetical protein RINTHM_7950 [Richelia intracellularis HM01]|uniref:DUF3386 domain-containing protein n=1 Tax=Richelia intracellularis TaxID=1164990 RepID=UPI0002B56136|nr:DUF3386 domain-containing protein [Richelia intracellularis]CCH65258.1 hypothetical protein RINTHM_7950 [Richelia intracellularis HM01]